MSVLGIYFDEPGRLDAPLNDPMYFQSYRAFSEFCASQGDKVVILRGDSYSGPMTFREGWEFQGNDLIPTHGEVTVDLVYMKSLGPAFTPSATDLIVNPLTFGQATNDKWTMYETFPEFMPASYRISNDNWREVLDAIATEQVVLKPRRGSGGKGILILPKADFNFPSLNLSEPYIAQNFIDSSGGIPGVCSGYHDLRILFFNDTPKLAFLRIPQEGKLLSNVSQGASAHPVDLDAIPQEILTMALGVDAKYRQYAPRHYSADFFLGADRPYLVETNTQPGFPRLDAEGEAFQMRYYSYLWELLTNAVKERTHAN